MEIRRKWRTQPGEILRRGPVVPVMVVHRLEQAVPLAMALVAGGIRVLEITLRTPVSVQAIAAIRREVSDAANRGPLPLIPGIATVSELMTGLARGYDHFKFFPAEAAGGVKMLQAFAGPFPRVTFCPTGGITTGNYREYLAQPNVACVGGSWVAPAGAIEAADWPRITALAREAVAESGR
jgi:2-dehydro-3-deoxyphosphogluconate aldolase/(4S)-4-hydroxy-2-oxoglutarate aldolase